MSFQQGLSGLNSSAKNLDTIGNNVANASTVGFKQSQTQFADAYAASLSGGNSMQTGSGSRVAAIAQQFSQGNISTTNNGLDIAISGGGFFSLTDPSGAIYYSRNGQFHEDKDGFIVNSLGHNLTGYEATNGVIAQVQPPVALQIDATDKSNPPQLTNAAAVSVNLDSAALGIAATFDPLTSTTYNSSTALAVYDSAGGSHVASLYYQRQPIADLVVTAGTATTVDVTDTTGLAVGNTITLPNGGGPGVPATVTITGITTGVAPAGTLAFSPSAVAAAAGDAVPTDAGSNTWNVFLTVDGTPVPNPVAAMTTLVFGVNGNLTSPTAGIASTAPAYAGAVPITFDLTASTQYAGSFNVNGLSQDGYAAGTLSGYSVGADGIILGRYTNGQTKALGQVLLSNFSNPGGLQPVGNNEWVDTVAAGNLGPLTPGSSGRGVLQSSAVEESNVDLTAELVNMIVAQRMYQANAQTIKAQDQILQTIVNLK